MKTPYKESYDKMHLFLVDAHHRIENGNGKFAMTKLANYHGVSRASVTIMKRLNLIEDKGCKNYPDYRWIGAKPTLKMAKKIRAHLNEYTNPRDKKVIDEIKIKSNDQRPLYEEVVLFFKEKGYSEQLALKAYDYYMSQGWKDKNGKPVKNWKLKMQSCWMVDWNDKYKFDSIEVKPKQAEIKEEPVTGQEKRAFFVLRIGRFEVTFF